MVQKCRRFPLFYVALLRSNLFFSISSYLHANCLSIHLFTTEGRGQDEKGRRVDKNNNKNYIFFYILSACNCFNECLLANSIPTEGRWENRKGEDLILTIIKIRIIMILIRYIMFNGDTNKKHYG